MRYIALFPLYFLASVAAQYANYQRPNVKQPPSSFPLDYVPGKKTRSLSGTIASDGNNSTNAMVMELITVGLLGGYAIRRVKMFNDRVYLARYRRSYWLGDRYYEIDNFYYLATRDTCVYRMNATERHELEYEDGVPIYDVIYQCQRYAEYCCGLDCCQFKGRRWADPAYDYAVPFSSGHCLLAGNNSLATSFLLCLMSYFLWTDG